MFLLALKVECIYPRGRSQCGHWIRGICDEIAAEIWWSWCARAMEPAYEEHCAFCAPEIRIEQRQWKGLFSCGSALSRGVLSLMLWVVTEVYVARSLWQMRFVMVHLHPLCGKTWVLPSLSPDICQSWRPFQGVRRSCRSPLANSWRMPMSGSQREAGWCLPLVFQDE